MHRCIQLASHGAGYVAPNPLVGAVLVHNNQIIGEGYHREYGGPHAEVNCISQAIQNGHEHLLSQSVLYVSLEPCAHFGKTPPCADLIIQKKIPTVYIGCPDPFTEVDGKGIQKLQSGSVQVYTGVLEKECMAINKRFLLFHTQHRPHIVLKWAQTANRKIAGDDHSRLLISNEFTNRLVHRWRSEESSILVGTNTALLDDPELTARLWPGPSPVRLVVDMDLKLPSSLKLFSGAQRTIVFNKKKHDEKDKLLYYQVGEDADLIHQIIHALYQLNIQSVMVEGGAKLLQSFIDADLWDEARIITNEEMEVAGGLPAPELINAQLIHTDSIASDTIRYYEH